jgi:hypothetical protein
MFVVAEDFDFGDFILVGLDKLDAGEFDFFVNQKEEENLRKLLGNLLYDAFVDGLNVLEPNDVKAGDLIQYVALGQYQPGDEVIYIVKNVADIYACILETDGTQLPTDTNHWTKQVANRWIRLKWGDSFTYNLMPEKWYGFKTMVIPMIYSLWISRTFRTQTSSGMIVQANENSTTVSPNDEIIRGWNKYSELSGGSDARLIVYDDWFYSNWGVIKNTLFGYIYCKSTDFDDLIAGTNFNYFKAYLGSGQYHNPGRMNLFDL